LLSFATSNLCGIRYHHMPHNERLHLTVGCAARR
jgi:hypothetical protein